MRLRLSLLAVAFICMLAASTQVSAIGVECTCIDGTTRTARFCGACEELCAPLLTIRCRPAGGFPGPEFVPGGNLEEPTLTPEASLDADLVCSDETAPALDEATEQAAAAAPPRVEPPAGERTEARPSND